MLLGIAECILNVIIFPFIADIYPVEQRSFIIQVICTATPIGSGLGYILGSWAASHFGGWFYALRITPIFSGLNFDMINMIYKSVELFMSCIHQ